MTDGEREAFEKWYSWCSFNTGNVKYACHEAWQAAIAHTHAETAVVLPKFMPNNIKQHRDDICYTNGFNDALRKLCALNPDVKFVEDVEKE